MYMYHDLTLKLDYPLNQPLFNNVINIIHSEYSLQSE